MQYVWLLEDFNAIRLALEDFNAIRLALGGL